MNKIASILILGLFALTLFAVVTSCNENNPEEPAPPPTDEDQCKGSVYSENFNGLSETILGRGNQQYKQLSRSGEQRWFTSFWTFQRTNPWYYRSDNVASQLGKIVLSQKYEAATATYSGGEINMGSLDNETMYSFGNAYEARIKVAKGAGVVTAFFGYKPDPDDDHNKEIDIEVFGSDQWPYYTNMIVFTCWIDRQSKTSEYYNAVRDLSQDFHRYRFDWYQDKVDFFLDGVLVKTIRDHVPQVPINVKVNTWVEDDAFTWTAPWFSLPGQPQGTSSQTVVDYICINPLSSSRNIILFDDFTSASNITNSWVLSGSPRPVWVSSAFGRTGLFDNNGDSWYTSVGYSKTPVGSTNGFAMESEVYLNVTNTAGCWVIAGIGLTKQTNPTPIATGQDGDLADGIDFSLTYEGAACWGTPTQYQHHAYFWIGISAEDGTADYPGSYDLNADSYVNGWHIMKIVVGSDRYVKFYCDNNLIWPSRKKLDPSLMTNRNVVLGYRSSGSAGKCYHDWVRVRTP